MKNRKTESKLGFEVLSKSDDGVVYKRVLNNNSISSKERRKREMDLPKVTMLFFDIDDIENLQRIQNETIVEASNENLRKISKTLNTIKNILVK